MAGTPEAVIGHPELDAQHNTLVHLLADVSRAIGAEDVEAARSALESFWHASVSHFANEDALMEEHAYPERNAHRTGHYLFLEDLKALLQAIREEGLSEKVSTWALKRIPEWMSFHIETNDAPLARHIARRTAARVVANMRGENEPPKSRGRDA